MIKAVVFDSDGMLLHGTRFSDAYSADFGIPIDDITPFFTGPFKGCVIGKADLKDELSKGWLAKWKWEGTVDELLEYWFTKGSEPNREVLDTIPKLKDKNILCLLATNQEKYRAEFFAKRLEFENIFDKLFISAHIGCKKTETRFLDTIKDYLTERDATIKKDDVLFWDDRPECITAISDFGFQTTIFTDNSSFTNTMHSHELL